MGKYGKGDTSWFTHDRFGMFIHWGLYSMLARHEWIRHYEQISNEEYQKYFDLFYPDMFNPKEWAKAAKEAGMKYFVITTKASACSTANGRITKPPTRRLAKTCCAKSSMPSVRKACMSVSIIR